MTTNTTRFKPYTLSGEPTASTVELIDEMFGLLFKDLELNETRALLASTLSDVTAGVPTAGALIVGGDDATSKWEVMLAGTEGQFLRMTSGMPGWVTNLIPGVTDTGGIGTAALLWANAFINDVKAVQTLVVGGSGVVPTNVLAHFFGGTAAVDPTWQTQDVALFESAAGVDTTLQLFCDVDRFGAISFSDTTRNMGAIFYNHNGDTLNFRVNSATRFTITSAGLFNFVTDSGVGIVDTDASHYMRLDCGSNLTADRVLSVVPGDAARTVTLTGNPTLADWFDQSVKTTASPTFVTAFLSGNLGIGALSFGGSAASVCAIANGTAPTTSPADMVQIYAADVAATSELFARNEAGAIRQLTALRGVVATQFDKAANTTLGNITGLTVNVVAGKTYAFEAVLFVAADATGGSKFTMSGTATATSIVYEIELLDEDSNIASILDRKTALDSSSAQAGTTNGFCRITGSIVVNGAGTLTVQFAQSVANGTSSVLVGSSLLVHNL